MFGLWCRYLFLFVLHINRHEKRRKGKAFAQWRKVFFEREELRYKMDVLVSMESKEGCVTPSTTTVSKPLSFGFVFFGVQGKMTSALHFELIILCISLCMFYRHIKHLHIYVNTYLYIHIYTYIHAGMGSECLRGISASRSEEIKAGSARVEVRSRKTW